MGTLIRGIKNIFRNKSRNIAVILILTLSLSFALMMINMNFLLNSKVKDIKDKWGNEISVVINTGYVDDLMNKKRGSSATAMLYFDESMADDILKIDSVKAVTKGLMGNFYSKKLLQKNVSFPLDRKGKIIEVDEKINHSIRLIGIDNLKESEELVKGSFFKETDIDQNVAVIADTFAERNNLKVDSKIIINNEKVKVCGIYASKSFSAPESILTPLKTAQRLLDLEGKIDSALSIAVDSLDNVQKVVDYINNVISDGKIEAYSFVERNPFSLSGNTINKISKVAKVGMISAFLVGVLIILSVMFINTRQRAREIGILKAIGASNLNISAQFLVESITLCAVALILSIVIILTTSQVIADFIVEREESSLIESGYYVTISGEMPEEDLEKIPEDFLKKLYEQKRLKITLSPKVFISSIVITFLLGAIGSLIPAYYISKLRPAEVLRFE